MSDFYRSIEQDDSGVARVLLDRVQKTPDAVPMHYGSPAYDPTGLLQEQLKDNCLRFDIFQKEVKKYEEPRGSLSLRCAIADFYNVRHNLNVDPEKEIILTNGSVEAFTLSVMVTTNIGDFISTTNPTYMLFSKAAESLGRKVNVIDRPPGVDEYSSIVNSIDFGNTSCFVINSPENPTGYVLSSKDWVEVSKLADKYNFYIIHDEILSALDFDRMHIPSISIPSLKSKSVLVNGFSKVFGMPGIKLGWMVAESEIINRAIKYHDYLYLGVNPISENIAINVLENKEIHNWLDSWRDTLRLRTHRLLEALNESLGYEWPRTPHGGLSLTPKVDNLYDMIPTKYKDSHLSRGASVSNYLFDRYCVSVTPASVYGSALSSYIKIVTCGMESQFEKGILRLQCKI
ncbi:Arginine--pyruvate transaminase AruH (plasmid) [Piscirickettsia salmonis]|uniref:pyridoxal phosphate-dependent aminotransferase n=1 Tax=Piscirickettsia salmonis TaxID=1238 RepID=UPI0012B7AF17|nr:pyridoxal phosphate-dependent aminotransferase [Piscirickettsia salmonis]QGP52490.1 Arginine--pyruvate transaminase AruH [Piscirickettsia salmonis]